MQVIEQHEVANGANDPALRLLGFPTAVSRKKHEARARVLLANWLAETGQGYHGDIQSKPTNPADASSLFRGGSHLAWGLLITSGLCPHANCQMRMGVSRVGSCETASHCSEWHIFADHFKWAVELAGETEEKPHFYFAKFMDQLMCGARQRQSTTKVCNHLQHIAGVEKEAPVKE